MSEPNRERERLLARLRGLMERFGAPRVEVSLILALAGVCGAACSFVLLRLGVEGMWLRYPISAAAGYVVFVTALRIWASRLASRVGSELEAVPETSHSVREAGALIKNEKSGLDFNLIDLLDFLSIDDFALAALTVLVIVLAATLATVILTAPVLLSEAILDGLLITGLWRRFMRSAQGESIWGAVRETRGPAAAVILALAGIGYLLQVIDPTAKSIGDLFR